MKAKRQHIHAFIGRIPRECKKMADSTSGLTHLVAYDALKVKGSGDETEGSTFFDWLRMKIVDFQQGIAALTIVELADSTMAQRQGMRIIFYLLPPPPPPSTASKLADRAVRDVSGATRRPTARSHEACSDAGRVVGRGYENPPPDLQFQNDGAAPRHLE